VIAPSFGDIFAGNAVQNGLLTAVVSEQEAAQLAGWLNDTPALPMTVNLDQQTIAHGAHRVAFTIDPVRRKRLLNGWEDIDLTRSHSEEIAAFKAGDRRRRPWAWELPWSRSAANA
jgi:3-isopropylmalate/(R)-2-methylmalate dehydratase small subunit